jgi:HD-like signal output (HDOD) protein
MPGVSGQQLLAEVSNRHPHVIRIVLSGTCDRQEALSWVAGAHQFLAKPCDVALLKTAVERALSVQEDLADGALKRFIARLASLPSLPSVYLDLVEAAQDPQASAQKLGRILSRDVAMTSKVLHIVNSPLFGIGRKVLNPADACVFLGIDTIQTLVLSIGIFSQFRRTGVFSAEDLHTHSLTAAHLARRIAMFEALPKETVEECFLGGMLHDVGKLVMAVNCSKEYDGCLVAAQSGERLLTEIEMEIFGVTHADAGMYLLRLWGLPEGVTEVVALHHRPAHSPERRLGPLGIVHAANVLVRPQFPGGLDLEYLDAVQAHLAEWRNLAGGASQGAEV